MVQTKRILVIAGGLILLSGTSAGVVRALQERAVQGSPISRIDKQCRDSVDEDGFGHATVSDSQIKNQTGKISVDCILKIPNGTTVQMQNLQLTTKKLLIEAGESNETRSHLVLTNVNWSSPDGGLQITMQPNYSTLSIKDSQFDYPLSIGAAIGVLDDDLQTAINVQNSQFTSKGQNSDGIQLVAIGDANFTDNQFYLSKQDDIALILGQNCKLKNNSNANQRCHAP